MATLPANAAGEVRLTLRIPNGDGTDSPAVGYAWLYPNLRPGTMYRASNVDPQLATRTLLEFDGSGNLEDPETDTWAKVLASDAPGASFVGMQWVLEFHLENVKTQPERKYFTVPAGSFVNVGLVADTSSQPSSQPLYLDNAAGDIAELAGQVADLTAAVGEGASGKILVVGSSIAAGTGASTTAQAYPAQIAASLKSFTGIDFAVVAAGVSGDNSEQMFARLPALLAEHRPTIVVLEGSINDSRTDVVLTVDQSALAMQNMVTLVRMSGALPIITTSAPWNPFWYPGAATAFGAASYLKSEQINARRRLIASSQDVLLVDIYQALKGGVGLLSDGLHPNNTGHSRWGWSIGERIATQTPSLKSTLKVADDFNRVDNASLGAPWTNLSGTHGVVSNAAQGAGTYATTVQPVGINVVAQATFRSSSNGVGLVARATNSSNYIAAEYSKPTTVFNVYTRVGGTFATKGTFIEAMADGDTISLIADSNHIVVYHNEHPVCGFNDTGTVPDSANVGLWSANTYVADSFYAWQ